MKPERPGKFGFYLTFVLASLLAFDSGDLLAQVRFNELLASNRFSNFDEEGDSSDWVEIYNPTATDIGLEGYFLTDDRDNFEKWAFPEIVVPARGYLLVWASGKDRFVPPPEAIAESTAFEPVWLEGDEEWRYLIADPGQSGPPAGWQQRIFDDSPWLTGDGGFGYGDGDDSTILPVDTGAVFTRYTFRIDDPQSLSNMVLQVDYDDGFVAFLNGVRVAAGNAPGGTPNFQSVATGKHEAGTAERFDLTDQIARLVAGSNVLSVVGLNDIPSSDMSLRVELGVVPTLLHTNFELASIGEDLLLIDPKGQIADIIVFPEQAEDHSYGLNSGGEWKYFLTPTPGTANGGQFFDEPISGEVTFSPDPGIFAAALNVEITTTLPELTEVRYTIDGSEPIGSSTLYTGSIRVSNHRVFRAAGFIGGERSTRILSGSYFIGTNYVLPVMSISMIPEDYATVHNSSSARGRASERPAFIEYIERGGERVVATGLGMRLHGGAGRGGDFNTKKSYKVYFRGAYGDKKLNYRMIPDTEVESFDKLVLRGGFNDSFRTNGRSTYLRDQLIRDLHKEMGAAISHGSWCMLYVNMRFRGLYNIVERMDDEFMSSYNEGEEWDMIKTGNDVLRGTRDEWDRLRSFAVSNDLSNGALYSQFLELIDIENFTSYMILNMWAQNHDWPHNNWYASRERVPEGKWVFLSWDAEFGIGLNPSGYSSDSFSFTLGRGGNIRDVLVNVLENADYRRYFIEQLDLYSATVLEANNVRNHINRLASIVTGDMPEEMTQFGQNFNNWSTNVNRMLEFATHRTPIFFDFVQNSNAFDFPVVGAPLVYRASPTQLVNVEGARVSLIGARLAEDTRVFFNGIESPSTSRVNQNQLRAVLPFSSLLNGLVTVRVLNPSTGEARDYPDLFNVILPIPQFEDTTALEGDAIGGELLVLQGRYFMEDTEVFFDEVPAPSVEYFEDCRLLGVCDEFLRVITPPGEGQVQIRVVNLRPERLESEETIPFTYVIQGTPFRRGDANGDAAVDISDAVTILGNLFLGEGDLPCLMAADANASAVVDLSDAVSVLSFLFQGGAVLPAPFPGCGIDETSELSCGEPPACDG